MANVAKMRLNERYDYQDLHMGNYGKRLRMLRTKVSVTSHNRPATLRLFQTGRGGKGHVAICSVFSALSDVVLAPPPHPPPFPKRIYLRIFCVYIARCVSESIVDSFCDLKEMPTSA